MRRCHYYIFMGGFIALLMAIPYTSNAAEKQNGVKPSLDVAQYEDTHSKNNYIEIYYSLPETSLNFMRRDSASFMCRLVLDLEMYHNEQLLANKIWKIEKQIADTSSIDKGSQLVDLLRYFVDDSGAYRIKLRVRDMYQPEAVDSAQTVFTVRESGQSDMHISDVELATNIRRSTADDSQSKLVKNNYLISPNPSAMFGEGSSRVFYYYETYNLSSYKNQSPRYLAVSMIQDAYGNKIDGVGAAYRTRIIKHDSNVELGMLNVSNLPSGKYKLIYGIADSSRSLLTSQEKDFFIYNPDVPATQLEDQGNFGPLSLLKGKQLDEEFKYARYILSKEEKEIYTGMTNDEAKRKFLYEMWAKPRSDYSVSGLPFREEYLARVHFANDHYTSVFEPGWHSDRGRVFILYGFPSSLERFPSTQESVPYQIWTYDFLKKQSGVKFVFADNAGFNRYELIHSTLSGELQDFSWKKTIARGTNEKIFK